jgi:IclR family transcriptional regulator, KDG regulon repressor
MLSNSDSEPSVQSIDRAVQVLRCFEKGDKLGLTEISKAIGLHKSTTYGIVTTLKNNGFLDKNEDTGKYQLGIELYRIAANVQVDLRDVCQPHIKQLCGETGETVNLVIPDDTHVIYIEKWESAHSVRISTSIGKRLPMYCTGAGKAILAFLPDSESSSILDKSMLVQHTKNTLVSKEALVRQLEEVREKGFAVDMEELEDGLICVAVPIMNPQHRPVAALSCAGPKQRMSAENIDTISVELLKHAREIAQLLIN